MRVKQILCNFVGMNKTNRFHIASSLVLLAIFFSFHGAFAQMPKLFLKFVEKQNKVQSGYVKLQRIDMIDEDSLIRTQEGFFISTSRNLKYLIYSQWPDRPPKRPQRLNVSCKSAYTIMYMGSCTRCKDTSYWYDDEIYDAKDQNNFSYRTANGISVDDWKECIFQRILPKIDKNNIRYKILYPDALCIKKSFRDCCKSSLF